MKNLLKTLVALTLIAVTFLGSCKQKETTPATEEVTENNDIYLEKGKEIATASFAALGSQLKAAIESGGVPSALQYCNIEAMPLTDSLSNAYNASIRRTTMQPRNPSNAPSLLEKAQLTKYSEMKLAGEEIGPTVVATDDGSKIFYSPIMLNDFCLQCHGTVGKELAVENYEVIKNLYPADEAVGYIAGDLRGMWSITFRPENNNH